MRRQPPFGLSPRDAKFLVLYLGSAILMFGALGLAWAFPRLLLGVLLLGFVGAYLLARLYARWD